MKTLTKLELVDKPAVKAAFLSFRMTPAFVGTDCDDLVCGGCGAILCEGVSEDSFSERFSVAAELVGICPHCRAKNRLPARVVE